MYYSFLTSDLNLSNIHFCNSIFRNYFVRRRLDDDDDDDVWCYWMQTIGFDPMTGGGESRQFGVEWMTLDELWPKADYITLHTPLIARTKRE